MRPSKTREQYNKAWGYFQYPDVVHVKKDSLHSDIVCLKEFGSAYMEVVKQPEEYETETYVKLSSFVKFAAHRLGQAIDRLRDESKRFGTELGGQYEYGFNSSRIEELHYAIGTLIGIESDIRKYGEIRDSD